MTNPAGGSLVEQTQQVKQEFSAAIDPIKSQPLPDAVEKLRIEYLGRKGKIPALLEGLRHCSKDERPIAGKAINELKNHAESAIGDLREAARQFAVQALVDREPLDISLPVNNDSGSLHPVTLMRQEMLSVFARMGFTVFDGPETEFEEYNFNALNIPDYHPARDMQDTFYVDGRDKMVMRTHTSNVQIHCMKNEKPPMRIVAPGRVFRCDSDPTHTPMFHQIEAFAVDKNINFAHLKGTIDLFIKEIFGKDAKTRLRPSFFPFVEPGAEVDMLYKTSKGTAWLEIGGCGMIHPNVFEAVGIDSEEYTGWAFGFGLDRMAMLKYKLPDLRLLFEGDRNYLGQFPIHT